MSVPPNLTTKKSVDLLAPLCDVKASADVNSAGLSRARVLFLQATEPANYPPLMHASMLMADNGWEVTFLSAPMFDWPIALPPYPHVNVQAIRARPSHVMRSFDYVLYTANSIRLALRLRPDVIYASDTLAAGPGLLAAKLVGAELIYHEHDSPRPGSLNPIVARLRAAAARSARLVVFPNEARAQLAQSELGFSDDKLRIVWNVPRREEIISRAVSTELPLIIYYHGSITPERLPETVALAVRRLDGRALLRIAGYEAPGARGYVSDLMSRHNDAKEQALIEYIGPVQRADLLAEAARAHVGLSLIPLNSGDVNMCHMAGASNKPFDYMAAGLALLVSDLPDWKTMFVDPGFALACDPTDADSLSMALSWFIEHPEVRRAMAARARNKIETEWNYNTIFGPILGVLSNV
jgi:glycosyltransferase involved in cell wall biosynthesis